MSKEKSRYPLFKLAFIAFVFFLCIMLVYFTFLYHKTQQNKTADYAKVKEIVMEQTQIIEIDDILRFHGEEAFYVVFGTTENNEEKIAFVPFEYHHEEPITTINQSEIISQENILNKWRNQCSNCKFIKIIPGKVNDELVWELTYIDSTDRYVFDYLSIYDGTQYEQLRFKMLFK